MAIALGIGMGLSAIGGIASSAARIRTGKKQIREGEELAANNIRPVYDTPDAVDEAVDIGRDLSLQGLPGLARIREQIDATASDSVRGIQEMGGGLGAKLAALSGVNQNSQRQQAQVGIEDATARLENMRGMIPLLFQKSQFDDKEFMYNRDEPFRDKAAAAEALIGAGMQNRMGGIDSLTKTISGIGRGIAGAATGGDVMGDAGEGMGTNLMGQLKSAGITKEDVINYMTKFPELTMQQAIKQMLGG